MPDLAADRKYRSARLLCWCACTCLALVDAWAGRQYIDADGISYLDMSDAFLKHNWHLLINPQWSPLYPFMLGVATWIAHPTAYWEFPTAHLVNLAIFIGALASFEFLMRQVLLLLRKNDGQQDASKAGSLPTWIWQVLGYSLFAWSTFVMISGLRRVSPDLCVALFVFLDAGLLLKLRASGNKTRTSLLLGLSLGLGYLAKAILFPMAFVFMLVAFFAIRERSKALVPLLTTILAFAAIATPMVILISRVAGRPSYSESGPLNFVWQANGGDCIPFNTFRSSPDLNHRMHLLHEDPDVFSITGPVAATYSPWFDPEYWNAGAKGAFIPRNQIRIIALNFAGLFTGMYMTPLWVLVAGGIAIFFINPGVPRRFAQLAGTWPLLLPGVTGLCLYTLVLVLPRYIAPFLVLVLLGLFPWIFAGKFAHREKPIVIATTVTATAVFLYSALFVVLHLTRPLPAMRGPGGEHYRAAAALNGDGVLPGQSVGLIGGSWDAMIWARLARVHIIAQMPEDDTRTFWQASDPRMKAEVYDAFAKAGAKAVITEQIPPPSGIAEWQKLADTPYSVHMLATQKTLSVSTPNL